MGPAATFAAGIVAGLVLFLGMAIMGVIAVNGTNNPGVTRPAQAAAAGATANPAADAPAAPKPSRFHSLDLDGDGRLSIAEAAGHSDVVLHFDRADRNRDGKLTPAEYERLGKVPPPKVPKARPAKKSTPAAGP